MIDYTHCAVLRRVFLLLYSMSQAKAQIRGEPEFRCRIDILRR